MQGEKIFFSKEEIGKMKAKLKDLKENHNKYKGYIGRAYEIDILKFSIERGFYHDIMSKFNGFVGKQPKYDIAK